MQSSCDKGRSRSSRIESGIAWVLCTEPGATTVLLIRILVVGPGPAFTIRYATRRYASCRSGSPKPFAASFSLFRMDARAVCERGDGREAEVGGSRRTVRGAVATVRGCCVGHQAFLRHGVQFHRLGRGDGRARGNVNNRIALWFMRWARCPQTAEYRAVDRD